jgi:MoaA/NifB/PqqE/SkfB family radical SAM enzyme
MSSLIGIERVTLSNNYFLVNWMLHDKCTYDCSYCPPSNKAGDDEWLKIDFAKNFLDNLEQWIKTKHPNKHVLFLLTGGEPTVWPKFVELIDHIRSKGWHISMSTNASRNLRWWQENQSKFFRLNISYHSEHADHEEFMEKVNYINQERSGHNLKINVMMNPRAWDKCLDILERLENCDPPVSFDVRPLQPNFGLQDINIDPYSLEQSTFIKDKDIAAKNLFKARRILIKKIPNLIQETSCMGIYEDKKERVDPNQLIMDGKANFYGWECNIGIEQIFINSLGKVYGGTCLQGPLLGNISKGDITWPETATVCQTKWCGCYTDILVSKWKSL